MKKIILSFALLIASFATTAQVGFGTTSPEGALDVVSSNSGIIVPRVANTAAVTSPVNGMLIYDLSTDCFKVFVGGVWSDCFGQNAEAVAVAAIVAASNDPADGTPSIADLTDVGLSFLTSDQADYEVAIANANPVPTTLTELQAIIHAVNHAQFHTTIVEVTGPTGKIWMDRNLGASQVATSRTDTDAYGDLYQWGRTTDGHEKRNSTAVAGPVVGGTEGANFITNGGTHQDWLSIQDNTRWGATKTANDPCPRGYRVPTETELNAERLLFATNDSYGAFGSVLKLPTAGDRNLITAAVREVTFVGYYWSSTINGTKSSFLYFDAGAAYMYGAGHSWGFSVRCIKE